MKKKPEYLNIYEKLRSDIAKGIYPVGARIPSKRNCADRFGVSVITVQHAYELLEDEGYIESRQRSGFFAAYGARPMQIEKQPFSGVLGADGVNTRLMPKNASERPSEPYAGTQTAAGAFPFSVYAKAVRRILTDRGEDVLVKSPGQGCIELREAISGYLARTRDIIVSPDRIVIGSGAEHLYGLIIDMIGRYRSYGIEDPSYGKIHQVYKLNGAHTELLPLGRNGISSQDLEKSTAGVLHITPYRSYPSGISANAAKKREYIAFARRRGAWIIEDDFESEFTPSTKAEETIFEIDGGIRVIYVNSFTMTVSPGIRTAYMVLPELLVPVYKERLGFCSCTVPTLDQLVLADLISSGDFERHINRVRRKNRSAHT